MSGDAQEDIYNSLAVSTGATRPENESELGRDAPPFCRHLQPIESQPFLDRMRIRKAVTWVTQSEYGSRATSWQPQPITHEPAISHLSHSNLRHQPQLEVSNPPYIFRLQSLKASPLRQTTSTAVEVLSWYTISRIRGPLLQGSGGFRRRCLHKSNKISTGLGGSRRTSHRYAKTAYRTTRTSRC
jgi:hypothetical protein